MLEAVGARHPDVRILVRTRAPAYIFEQRRHTRLDIQPCDTDVGMVQIDSLRIDEAETARRAAAFYATFDDRVEREADWIRAESAALVVGDIPPLAFAAASLAGVPSLALGNFTWDWIYEASPPFETLAPDVLPIVRDAYAQARRALRLPFHGGFAPMASRLVDIPLVARQSRLDPHDTRQALHLDDDRPVVLVSFGAYGAPLPYDRALAGGRLILLSTEREVADASSAPAAGLVRVDSAAMRALGLRYEDLVAAADAVLSKPGYGIVSECVANRTPLLCASRGRFREQEVFLAEMPRVLRTRLIPEEELFAGRWTDAIEALLGQAEPPERLRIDGAAVAAEEILGMV